MEEFIDYNLGRPLGMFSEQELENAHSSWNALWSNYKVNNMTSPHYKLQLGRAGLAYNASHV